MKLFKLVIVFQNGTCPNLAPDVNLEEVSHLCNNFSGADCDQLVYLASKEAIREVISNNAAFTSATACASASEGPEKRLVARRHFSAALKKIKPSITVEVCILEEIFFHKHLVLSMNFFCAVYYT